MPQRGQRHPKNFFHESRKCPFFIGFTNHCIVPIWQSLCLVMSKGNWVLGRWLEAVA